MSDAVSGAVARMLAEHHPGWSLPQAAYTDVEIFDADLERISRRAGSSPATRARSPSPGTTSA